jgi:carboxyl-terminal processing protease
MKKIVFTIALIMAAVAILSVSCASNKPASESSTIREEFVTTFDMIHGIVSERYCHFYNKSIDPSALYDKYITLIRNSDDIVTFKLNMLQYFAELKNTHSRINFEEYGVLCEAKLIEYRVFIDKIYKPDLYAGFHEKDEIIAVDDVPVLEWIIENTKYVSASTVASLINRTAASIFFSYFPVQRKYLVKSDNGLNEVILDLEKMDSGEWYSLYVQENVKGEILEEDIGYIALNSMTGSLAEFETEYFKVEHLPYLIVDVRRNGGGNSGLSEKILAYLIKKPKEACVSRAIIQPHQNYYKGKLILLTDVMTGSAADSFALDIKESERAIIVGLPTDGDTGNGPQRGSLNDFYGSPPDGGSELRNTIFMIPTRKPPQISPKGFPMEGIGVPPDYYVVPNVEDYLNNVDGILEFAIALIKNEEI